MSRQLIESENTPNSLVPNVRNKFQYFDFRSKYSQIADVTCKIILHAVCGMALVVTI